MDWVMMLLMLEHIIQLKTNGGKKCIEIYVRTNSAG